MGLKGQEFSIINKDVTCQARSEEFFVGGKSPHPWLRACYLYDDMLYNFPWITICLYVALAFKYLKKIKKSYQSI